jgi:hypothetical protein
MIGKLRKFHQCQSIAQHSHCFFKYDFTQLSWQIFTVSLVERSLNCANFCVSSEKSKRRTRTIANTTEPRWNQSFVYSSIRRADLKLRILEITVWDYVHYGANDFLGEVVIELTSAPLNDEPEWYYLSAHEDILPQHPVHFFCTQNSLFHPKILLNLNTEKWIFSSFHLFSSYHFCVFHFFLVSSKTLVCFKELEF